MARFLFFSRESPEFILSKGSAVIFHFFNLHDLWWWKHEPLFAQSIGGVKNYFFPDGKMIARWLGIAQQRGPAFTKRFLLSPTARNARHLFLGIEEKELGSISKVSGIKRGNLFSFNPPFVKGIVFSKESVAAIVKSIQKQRIDLVWVGIGCPKQNILAHQLFEQCPKVSIFCVGAAVDFFLGKKKESPKLFTALGIEWLYRLLTDFSHTKKKVYRHALALRYLRGIKLR